jgi:hypothetical protein
VSVTFGDPVGLRRRTTPLAPRCSGHRRPRRRLPWRLTIA